MPTVPVKLTPGINAEYTPALNEGGYSACNLIRFKAGLPQKYGGWVKYINYQWNAPPRALHAWQSLAQNNELAVGTANTLDVVSNGVRETITPQTTTTNPVPDFSTTAGSTSILVDDVGSNASTNDAIIIETPVSVGGIILQGPYAVSASQGPDQYNIMSSTPAVTTDSGGIVPTFVTKTGQFFVTVQLPNHGFSVGSTASFPIPTSVGGVTISGLYNVAQVPTANSYLIASPIEATSSATVQMNGGNAQIVYYVTPSPPVTGTGYGNGGYGLGGYGTGLTITPATGTPITVTDWSLDNFGQYLIACAYSGPIFSWSPSQGALVATLVPNAPTVCGGIFMSMPQEILVAWAASVDGVQDTLNIAWCTEGDFTTWVATTVDQAGTFRLPRGSAIIGGMQAPLQSLIWTDIAVWSMAYIGFPLVFSFNELASGCGLIGRRAMGVVNQTVFWMSQNSFFVLPVGGSVTPLPCTVWDVIFQNLDKANAWKIVAAPNSAFEEITWNFPSIHGDGENDTYVKFNVIEGTWDYGSLDRCGWIDQSILGPAIGGSPIGYVYQHETGFDADTDPMDSWIESGYWAMSETTEVMFADMIFPDMKYGYYNGVQTAKVTVELSSAMYPNGFVRTYGPYPMDETVNYVTTRLRGRLAKMRVGSDDLGSFWRVGNIRYRIAPDGKR